MIKDLRAFLRLLEEKGDLARISRPVDAKYEVAAGIRRTSDVQGPALLFESVNGYSMPVVGGLFAARRRWLWGFESTEEQFAGKYLAGIDRPIEPRLVPDGPCKEVVQIGEQANLSELPICTHSRLDAGPFITMGVAVVRDREYGVNASISRMQIFDDRTAALMSRPPQHLGVYFQSAEERDEPLEVAVVVGCDPYTMIASQVQGSIYLNELAVAGSWMGEPLEVLKCETIDVVVPATSEIVLEGELRPTERRLEGPFGEVTGYYNPAAMAAVFHLKAITRRREPIYVTGLTGRPVTDNHVMKFFAYEAVLKGRLRAICPTLRDVRVTDGGSGKHVVISMKPQFGSHARDVMLAALTVERIRPKLVIVVDEDIDPSDPAAVEWALATRMQADRDIVILPRAAGQYLDPSTPEPMIGAVMAIDATRPFGADWHVVDVPGVEDFRIPGWD